MQEKKKTEKNEVITNKLVWCQYHGISVKLNDAQDDTFSNNNIACHTVTQLVK